MGPIFWGEANYYSGLSRGHHKWWFRKTPLQVLNLCATVRLTVAVRKHTVPESGDGPSESVDEPADDWQEASRHPIFIASLCREPTYFLQKIGKYTTFLGGNWIC